MPTIKLYLCHKCNCRPENQDDRVENFAPTQAFHTYRINLSPFTKYNLQGSLSAGLSSQTLTCLVISNHQMDS